GMLRREEVIDVALPIALDVHRSDLVRYSAIVALMNGGSPEQVDKILGALQRTDHFYDALIECAAMLAAPRDIARILPFIFGTHTMLSAVFTRFRELRDRTTVITLLEYLAEHPETL